MRTTTYHDHQSVSTRQNNANDLQHSKGKSLPAVAALQKKEVAQLAAVEDEEPLQGKFETVQKVEGPEAEDEEALQGKFETVQRMEGPEAEEEEPLQGKFETVQRMEGPEAEDEETLQGKFATVQREEAKGAPASAENKTGLPNQLKAGIEALSGISINDVKVHYNSPKPAAIQAHAYAQGTEIHVAPGQEKHLPHEAWHTVQQKQGRVQPTLQAKGVPVNDDAGLEKEADVMGAKAMQMKAMNGFSFTRNTQGINGVAPIQGGFFDKIKKFFSSPKGTDAVGGIKAGAIPGGQLAGGIYGAVDTAQKGKVDLDPSYGGSSLGILGGVATAGMGAGDLVGAIKTGDTRRGLSGAMDVASGGLSIAGGALSMAGSAAVPGLGLASSALDTARSVGTAIYTDSQKKKLEAQHAGLVASGGDVSQQDLLKPGGGALSQDMVKQYQMLQIAKRAAVVREKQRNRAIVNSVASGVETAGHATTVGAGATGVGAIVGTSLVAGGKGIRAGAGLFRSVKQFGYDKGWWGSGKLDKHTSASKASDAMSFIAHAKDNYTSPEVQQSLELMGANKEQMASFKEGKLSVDEMYKLYKAR